MIRHPPRSTRPETLLPYPARFRSEPLFLMGDARARNIGSGAIQEFIVQVGDTVDVAAPRLSRRILPAVPVVEADPGAPFQVLAVIVRNQRTMRIGKGVEPNDRPCQLDLGRDGQFADRKSTRLNSS